MRPSSVQTESWLIAAVIVAACVAFDGVSDCPAQDLLISELLALNDDGLTDRYGDTSDWVEVTNVSGITIDIGGWFLTDDPADLGAWEFPPGVDLNPGDYLVVFASGRNQAVAGSELHTSFELDGGGEYLALVRPDGVTVEHEYAPTYPRQREDVSFGITQAVKTTTLVARRAAARTLVPSSGALGSSWTAVGFEDDAWAAATTGVGFETADDGNVELVVELVDLAPEGTPSQSSTLGSFTAFNAIDGDFGNFTHTAAGQNLPAIWEIDLGGTHALETIILHNRTNCCGSRLRDVRVSIHDPTGAVTLFESDLLNPENALGQGGRGGPASIEVDVVAIEGRAIRGRILRVTRTPDPDLSGTGGQGNRDEADVLSLGEIEIFGQFSEEPPGFGDLVQTDVEREMHGQNASIFLRVPFEIDTPDSIEVLKLLVHHDDGFVAYLNGAEVARRNAPAGTTWNSRATSEHADEAALVAEEINISAHADLLHDGGNVLAVHGLNISPDDTDFLISPALAAQSISQDAERYFPSPSPGRSNEADGIPGFVEDTKFSVDRGIYDENFEVEITSATEGVDIRYTLDGTPPSATDGILYNDPIPIDRTTVLRAMAFHPDFEPTNVDTHTYIFLGDIVRQDFDATLDAGFPESWGGTSPDYGMDPDVIGFTGPDRFGGQYNRSIVDDLMTLPTMSIVLDIDDMFGSRGIYTNSGSRGLAWERPCSVELIRNDGVEGFQENAGIRIQGGAFRSHGLTKKHSFRLLFREIYGPTKLRYPLMGQDAVDRFDTLTLRAGANDGYSWSAARLTEQYTRDQLGRDLQRATGNPGSRGVFVHLYVNGVYWGLYNPIERPDHSFSAQYLGGDKDEWDALSNGSPTNGNTSAWNAMLSTAADASSSLAAYQELQGRNLDGTRNPAYPHLLDVPNYVDYLIVNLWGGNWDWPRKNWWATRKRTPDGTGFKFYCWDFENTIGNNRGRSALNRNSLDNNFSSAGAAHASLKSNPEYRLLFADRARRFLFNDGPLTPQSLIPRFSELDAGVERSIVAESARWGDQHHSTPLTLREWDTERGWILNTYLPQRTDIVIGQFRAAGLYPSVEPPRFNQLGGSVPVGFGLALLGNRGDEILYTADGSDPRLVGGSVSPTAIAVGASSSTALVEVNAEVRVLVPRDGALGLDWVDADFADGSWRAGRTGVGFERGSGYEDEIATDVEADMYQQATTVYLRVAFEVDDPTEVAFLTLRMKYDDGFAAYLNGVIVASENAPAQPSWNVNATGSHESGGFESFDISTHAGRLRTGRNVLAVHGMNVTENSSDMLVLPELTGAGGGEAEGSVTIERSTRVLARTRRAGEWSALQDVTFTVGSSLLRITELMYHPLPAPAGSPHGREEFEFVEFQNIGDIPINLTGFHLDRAVKFTFPDTDSVPHDDLQPGETVLVVRNLDAFSSRYDIDGLFIAGEYSGRLGNGSDFVVLRDRLGQTVLSFFYSDDWHPSTDGLGRSLEILDQTAAAVTWSLPGSWRPSAVVDGTPGTAPPLGPVTGHLPGDVNQDVRLDISDAVAVLRHLFVAPRELPCDAAGAFTLMDVNGDSATDVSDAIVILDYLFRNSSPPRLGVGCVPIEGCPDACEG